MGGIPAASQPASHSPVLPVLDGAKEERRQEVVGVKGGKEESSNLSAAAAPRQDSLVASA